MMVTDVKEVREGYKVTDVGEIPVEWEVYVLESLVQRPISYGVLKPGEPDANGVPLIRINNIDKSNKFNNSELINISVDLSEEYQRTTLKGGEIVFSVVGTVGRLAIIPKELAGSNISRALAVIDCIDDKIDKYYLFYTLQSPWTQKKVAWEMQGNAQKVLNLGALRSLSIPIPSFKEQQKIAEILSTVDEQIENTNHLIDKTKELKKGLMQQLLTEGIGHTEFKETELGEIPVEWEVKELDNISHITRLAGAEYSDLWEVKEDGEIIALRGFNIGENKLILNNVDRITEQLSQRLVRSKLFKGDIVFPCVGTIGKATLINEDDKYHINQNIAKISPMENIFPHFLVYYLMSPFTKNQILKYNTSSSQPNVLVGNLRKFNVVVPSYEEQQRIAEILSTVDKQIECYEQEKEKYTVLKKGLMQQLLTGKLRVTV